MNAKTVALRTLLTLLILAAWAVGASAAGDSYFGFRGGVVIANMGGDMDDIGRMLADELEAEFGGTWTADKKSRTGFVGGLTYARMFKPTMGLQIEGMYASRGTKFDLATTGLSAEAELKFNYIEIPILLRFEPSPDAKAGLVLLVGPVVGFESGSKLKASAASFSQEGDLEDVKSVTFGLAGGLGLNIAMNEKSAVHLEARYQLGLSNAIDDPNLSSSANDLMFLAGMDFALGQ